MESSSPQQGALGCFDFPDQCAQIASTINARLKNITSDMLKPLSEIQFYYVGGVCSGISGTAPHASFYYGGTTWKNKNNPAVEDQITSVATATFDGNNTTVNYTTRSIGPGGDGRRWYWRWFDAKITPDGMTIDMTTNRGQGSFSRYFTKSDSPFYFEAYNA